MLAYHFPDRTTETVLDDERYRARLTPAWPRWHRQQAQDGGVILSPYREGQPPASSRLLGERRETEDGLGYRPPLEPMTLGDLARTDIPQAEEYTLACGLTVSVPLAAAAPAEIVLGARSVTLGQSATPYGQLAYDLLQRALDGDPMPTDDDYARLCFAALRECYHLTEELYADLGRWLGRQLLTTADLAPMIALIWGADPKSAAGDDTISPPSPPASSPSPDSPPTSGTSSPTTGSPAAAPPISADGDA